MSGKGSAGRFLFFFKKTIEVRTGERVWIWGFQGCCIIFLMSPKLNPTPSWTSCSKLCNPAVSALGDIKKTLFHEKLGLELSSDSPEPFVAPYKIKDEIVKKSTNFSKRAAARPQEKPTFFIFFDSYGEKGIFGLLSVSSITYQKLFFFFFARRSSHVDRWG